MNIFLIPSIDYDTEFEKFGIFIHLASHTVICITCKRCIHLHLIYNHIKTVHHGHRNWEFASIAESDFKYHLIDHGAKNTLELGLYMNPTNESLPVIDILNVEIGYQCTLCPTATHPLSFYTNSQEKIKDHLYREHAGSSSSYSTCHVQHLFADNISKKFFKVNSDICTVKLLDLYELIHRSILNTLVST